MIYAVDIDGVLCQEGSFPNYHKAVPLRENIDKVRKLFETGHEVILYSSRFEEDREVTEQWLTKHSVRYSRLILGKIRADIYVDDRNGNL